MIKPNHPCLPTNGQISSWEQEYFSGDENLDVLLIQAFQAGADVELKECCEYLTRCAQWESEDVEELRSTRRPKPPSLKEQALDALDRLSRWNGDHEAEAFIRRALEALPND